MSSIESSKTMAMVGTLLLVIGAFSFATPYVGVLSLIGIILLIMAIKGFSQYFQDPPMYDNALRGVVYYVIAAITLAVAFAILGLSILSFTTFVLVGLGIIGIVAFVVLLVVAFIFYVMAAKRLRMTLNAISQRTGEKSLATAGTLLYYGAILMIVFGLGSILIFIAWIFATIGFFQMRIPGQAPPPQQQPYGYAPPPPPTASQPAQGTRYCPNCGASVLPGTAFCPNCGKQLPPS